MTKKANTWVFILVATVFNVFLTLVCFFVLFALFFGVIVPQFNLPENVMSVGIVMVFILAIAGAFFIYRALLKIFTKKVDMEKHFDPLFAKRYTQKHN
jgi:hypothetical protein